MPHTSAPAQTTLFGTMSLESVKFGKDLPGYEYGPKEGPALIVIQVCRQAEYVPGMPASRLLPL